MLLVLLIFIALGEYLMYWDHMLSPLDINWPNTWVDNIISLSSNTAGEINVEMVVTCSVLLDLPIGTAVQLTVPGFLSSPYTIFLATAQLLSDDNIFSFPGVSLPSVAGNYGPISLFITQGISGQLLASSVTFGAVGITVAVPEFNGLLVSFTPGASTVVYEPTSLTFALYLAVNLQQYDFIVFSIDTNFKIGSLTAPDWTKSDATTAGLFNSTGMSYTDHKYNSDGSIGTAGYFIIYGLQQSVTLGPRLVFSIGGFFNPKYVGTNPVWAAKVMRFGTQTILQRCIGTGPGANTAGTITGTWAPTNGYITNSQIVYGTVAYMTLTFTLQHAVPKSGTITVIFNSATIATNNIGTGTSQTLSGFTGTFLDYSPASALSCSAASPFIVCTVLHTSDLAAGSTIILNNIVTFGISSANVDVESKTGTYVIDSKYAVVTQTNAAASVAMLLGEPVFKFLTNKKAYFTAGDANNNAFDGGNSQTIYTDLVITDTYTTALTVNLKFPVAISSTALDNSLALSTGVYIYGSKQSGVATTFIGSTDFTSSTIGINSLSATTSLNPSSGDNLSIQIAAGSSSTAAAMYLPYFASCKGTRYEVLVSYTNSAGIFKYYTKPFWISEAALTFFTVKAACATAGVPQMPVKITIFPAFEYSPAIGNLVYFDLAFTFTNTHPLAGTIGSNFGTGLTTGTNYPCSLTSGNLFLSATDSGHLLYSPLTAITTIALSFIVPMPGLAASGTIAAGITLYANRTSDGMKFNIAKLLSATKITAASTGAWENLTPITLITPTTITAGASGSSFTIPAVAATSNIGVITTSIFILEQGWVFASGATLKVGATASSATASAELTILTSSDPAWKWSIGYDISYFSNSAISGTQALLSGAIAPLYTSTASNIYYMASKHSQNFDTSAADVCELVSVGKISITPAILISLSYSPLISEGYGINVQTINLQIILSLPAAVFAGSVFEATVGSDFTSIGRPCKITSGFFTETTVVSNGKCTSTSGKLTSAIAAGNTVSFLVLGVIIPIITISNTVKPGFTLVTVTSSAMSSPANNIYMSYIDSLSGSDTLTRTTFSIGNSTAGTSNITTLKVIPNNLSAKSVHLYIRFTVSLRIPQGAKLTFYGETFQSDSNTKFTCWLSAGYSAVTISGSSITFRVNQEIAAGSIIEMRKDKAFDIPSTPASIWLISVGTDSYSNNIISDNSSTNSLNRLIYSNAPINSISTTSISTSVNNIGFPSLHTFKFIPGVDVTDSTWILFEAPFEYNAHIGPTVFYDVLPSVYWLSASSSLPGALVCSVDHWTIICSGFDNINSTSLIDISIYLSNPVALSVKWNIYIVSQDFSLLSNPAYDIPAAFTSLPTAGIDLYNIAHKIPAAVSSTHSLYLKFSDNYAAGSSIVVRFPKIYDLKNYNPGEIACQAWFNSSTGVVSFVAPGSYCKVNMNDVIFNVSSDAPFGGLWTTLQLKDVYNPTEGLFKKPNLDITQKTTINYDFWSTKFVVYYFSSANSNTIASMSIENLNAAYTGFFKASWLTVLINGGKTLYVTPGTFSTAYSIGSNSTIVSANNLTITPSDQNANTLKFDSESYVLTIDKPYALFRVGLSSSSAAGYYYITWNLIEAPLTSGILLYKPPRKTTVQAFLNAKTTVEVLVSKILSVSAKLGSLPISVSLAGGVTPYSGLDISLTESSSSFIFTPAFLVFNPGQSVKYFSIQATKTISSENTFYVNLTLTGSDSIAFSPKSQLASFTVSSTYSPPANITTYIKSSGKVNLTISLDTNSSGIATWALISTNLGSAYYDYNFLLSLAAPVCGEPSGNQKTVDQQVQTWKKKINSIDQTDWQAFSKNLLILSQSIIFCGQVFLNSGNGQKIYSFNELVANTSYTAAIWLDNLSGLNITLSTATVMTYPIEDPIQIDLAFGDTLRASYGSLLGVAISHTMLIQPSQVIQLGNLTKSRRLSTKASYLILGSLISSASINDTFKRLTPSALFNNSKALKLRLTAAPYLESKTLKSADFGVPALEDAFWNLTNQTFPVFSFSAAVDGFSCCAYQVNDSTRLTSEQIYLNRNEYRENLDNQVICWNVSEKGEYKQVFKMSNYTVEGNFTFSCTACNFYPIVPDCLSNEDVIVQTIERYTLNFSFAEYVGFALLIIEIA